MGRMVKPVAQLSNALACIKDSKCKKNFIRFKSDRLTRVKPNWRRSKGIDNRERRKFSGTSDMPGKGYKTPTAIKHLTPEGYRKVMISNIRDLEALKSLNSYYCGEIRHAIGAKKRIEIVAKADELGIFILNRTGKLTEDLIYYSSISISPFHPCIVTTLSAPPLTIISGCFQLAHNTLSLCFSKSYRGDVTHLKSHTFTRLS